MFICTMFLACVVLFFLLYTDASTTEFSTLSLHDALPISVADRGRVGDGGGRRAAAGGRAGRADAPAAVPRRVRTEATGPAGARSEEHTSELQSQSNLVCRLLLEKKKKKK